MYEIMCWFQTREKIYHNISSFTSIILVTNEVSILDNIDTNLGDRERDME